MKLIVLCSRSVGLLVVFCVLVGCGLAPAQDASSQAAHVDGVVHDSAGSPVAAASVFLQEAGSSSPTEAKTNADGTFAFARVHAGMYKVKVARSGFLDLIEDSIQLAPAEQKHCEFVLTAAPSVSSTGNASAASAIQLDDRPNFTVAGISDSTGSGGHGSETRMRTGEVLAKETLALESEKSTEESSKETSNAAEKIGPDLSAKESMLQAALAQSPRGFEANQVLGEFYLRSRRCRDAIPPLKTAHQVNPADYINSVDLAQAEKDCGEFTEARAQVNEMLTSEKIAKPEQADLLRLRADLDENLDDPLAAVHEYERAAALESSEQNYFAWGAELLLHGAAAPAIEVFGRGVRLHPDSARMLAGLGAALYTSGSADDAARRLCEASGLDPSNAAPYLFLGKIQESAPSALPCAEPTLARFVRDHPENALANYYYALALWKRGRALDDPTALQRAQAWLEKSAALDPKLASANLELGNLFFARGKFPEAVAAYQKAIAVNPQGSAAHYRLGLAYKRIGDNTKAQAEIEQYKQIDKTETAMLEKQRQEMRQFLFVLKDQTPPDQTQKH